MMLQEGKIAFFATPEEFEASPLPSVNYLTHPEAGMHASKVPVADPWKQSKKREDAPN